VDAGNLKLREKMLEKLIRSGSIFGERKRVLTFQGHMTLHYRLETDLLRISSILCVFIAVSLVASTLK